MSIDYSGINEKVTSVSVIIDVSEKNHLIKLANSLDWQKIVDIIIDDLKKTTSKLFWWKGRKIFIRTHLGVFLLQTFTKLTDRGIEKAVTYNAEYQIFCGKSIVSNWRCPDHTKIEKFRNRIKPETQQILSSYIIQVAKEKGFADPSKMDVDSTVQEANMTYPSDGRLLVKLSMMCKKVIDYIGISTFDISSTFKKVFIDLKTIKEKAKEYFFISNNKAKEKKYAAFKQLFEIVNSELIEKINLLKNLPSDITNNFKWNIKRTLEQIQFHATKYLEDVKYFIETQTMKTGKILSFHLSKVACIKKGKAGKNKEFGRVYQLGRIGGNFLIILPSNSIREEDKTSLLPMVKEHERLFGENVLTSVTADKKYYSKENIEQLQNIKTIEIGVQYPCNIKNQYYIPDELKNRRAGIEPLIGHVKKFGLGKSKMKSDDKTLAEGYKSVLGFNLHQFIKCLDQKSKVTI